MPVYREQFPPVSLARWVECVWSLESPVGIRHHRVAPDGCLDVLYDRRNSLRVIGAMTAEQRFEIAPGTQLFGMRFRPGMAKPFLGISAAQLTDKTAPLEDLWSCRARALQRQLDDATTLETAAQAMLGALRLPEHDAVQKAIGAIIASHGSADLDTIASHANLSPRQFRRRCLEESGLSPKFLSRVLRFRHASKLGSETSSPNWSVIAADAGYFDQSHLIHDFRDFTGSTPVSVFSNTQAAISE